jgi:putative membrane protein
MICNYNDHAANERTFLAWMRTGLSAIALGIVVEKGSLLALAVASSPTLAKNAPDCLSNYGGPVLCAAGIAVMLGSSFRFLRTALRIEDENTHPAGAVRVATALLRRRRRDSGAIDGPTAVNRGTNLKRTSLFASTKRPPPGETGLPRFPVSPVVSIGYHGRKPSVPVSAENLKNTGC